MFCGQGYDGAGTMAGKQKGVTARIMNKYLKALYTHYASHVLNLCIVEATNIADVRNIMNIASCVARFFNNSPKRRLAFDKFIDEQHQVAAHSSKRAKLKDLCKTRWVERQSHDAFEALYELYTPPVTSCECECSISKLRLLKLVRRSTMTEERLNGLPLISVHRDVYLDLDILLNEFARMHPRRLKLLFDE